MLLATCGSVAIALSTATHAKAATLAPAAPQKSEGKAVGMSDEVPVLSFFLHPCIVDGHALDSLTCGNARFPLHARAVRATLPSFVNDVVE